MTDKQLPPDWALAQAFREIGGRKKTAQSASIRRVFDRARELSAQQPSRRVRHSCEVDMLSECPGCEAESKRLWSESPIAPVAKACLSLIAQQPLRSTHYVHRGDESLPCYCTADMDHAIGKEKPDAARGEQPAWYGACHGVAAPYDHKKTPPGVAPDHHGKAGQRLQPARDGVALPDGWCTLGVGGGNGNLFVHGDYESIKACQRLITQPPQPTDGEAAGWFAKNRFDAWEEVDPQHAGEPGVVQLYLHPSRGVEVTEEDCHKAMDAAEYFNSNTNISLGAMRAALTSFTYTIMERDKREAALSGVQR